MLTNVNELSNKFIGDAYNHFKEGVEAIGRIRANLDEIHRDLALISKARGQNKND